MHKIYRKDEYVLNLIRGTNEILNNANVVIIRLSNLFHFNRLDIEGCSWWENLLKISVTDSDIENRRAKIRAKWLSNTHNDIVLLQNICESWKKGEVEVDFIEGKIKFEFKNDYGIPKDLDNLIHATEEVKPAHLSILWLYHYLLKKNIHLVMTKNEMETFKKHQYCDCKTGE